ncbi:hypothetical protein DEU42_104117 [Flavobacterium sp. AG291]|nr:hypothetical protein DEU42_104117 [Flavobacterium sp. AG291]
MFRNFISKKYSVYIIGIVYSILFFYGYIVFLEPNYGYAGFAIIPERMDMPWLGFFTYILVLVPLFFYSGINFISSFISIFIYYILYIPILFTLFLNMPFSVPDVVRVEILFCISMSLLFCADKIKFSTYLILPSRINVYKLVYILTILCTVYMLFVYRNSLRLVSFADVYDLRSSNDELGGNFFTAYLSSWLSNAFIPLTFVYGLFASKRLYVWVATFACLVIYMATAGKSVILFPLFMYGLYQILKRVNLNGSFFAIGAALIGIMLFTLLIDLNVFIGAVFWMRTLGNGGLLANYYYQFFSENPTTYYSHINFVNAITHSYPYGDVPLGRVIGLEYWGETNSNASFWATDGIAAMGEIGILFSSVILFFIFIFFNRVSKGYNKVFLILVLVPFINSLLNMSLFTSMLTGGGFVIFLVLMFSSSVNNKYINENFNNSWR